MRLLRLSITGAELYEKERLDLDFYATDRVALPKDTEAEGVHRIGKTSAIYSENVIGFTGPNASGKTTTLNLVRFALAQLTGLFTMRGFRVPVSSLGKIGNEMSLTAVFWHKGELYLIDSKLRDNVRSQKQSSFNTLDVFESFSFIDETIWQLKTHSRISKSIIADADLFKSRSEIVLHRNATADAPGHISDEVKAVLGINKSIAALITGRMPIALESPERSLPAITMPTSVVQAFDNSVEKLAWDSENQVFHLKFKGEPERIVSMDAAVSMLSRGTVYGAELVDHAIDVLCKGGYFIVDELEESLNRSLASMVIDLFASPVTNPHGAQMIFSTHYPELLDGLSRKDNVYVLTRNESYKTKVVKYSTQVSRIENKKSEVITSNYIQGSMPNYSDVQTLREFVREHVNG